MASTESIYNGADNFLIPSYYNSTEQQVPISELGMSVDPRTANQLSEINHKANSGLKHIEVQGISGDVWESVPEEHIDEMRRVMKAMGSSASFHGPLVEASGVSLQGGRGFDEEQRLGAERQLESAALRANRLDKNGNISVTVHSTAQLPDMEPHIKTRDGEEELTGFFVIDPETGRLGSLPPEKTYFPEKGKFEPEKKEKFVGQNAINKLNNDQWTEQLSGVNRYATEGNRVLDHLKKQIPEKVLNQLASGVDYSKLREEDEELKSALKMAETELNHGQIYLRDSYRNLKGLFDKAWTGTEAGSADRKKLREFAEYAENNVDEKIENDLTRTQALGEVVEKGLKTLNELDATPQTFKPLKEFVVDKTAETFSNVAHSGYKKYGEKAPVINIENPPAGGGLSRAEDLKSLVKETRKKLAENLANDKKLNLSKGQAKKQAEKMVGATWDVGHINMIRKKGYSEKDVIKETEIIAPYVKHVHLSDNFGLDHTELPMGMGNVPFKEIMGKLGEKGFEGKKIIEAGNWWQHFAERGGGSPFRASIEGMDSPIYAMGQSPYWSQVGGVPGYYSGHGAVNPAVHHSMYGAGFQALPLELGGEMPGQQSRFAGTPNQ
ncbi:sugar phosphate isomerase/epimerase [archaeon]|jgi:hypothetical protein|nr:sugar phosphate isomerase/epimerase [archaeon]MBT4241425.1 sugar phosphate isomerase/epimerase [archaeon]MBT4417704.1 sugar phosphate isomerase/epimerase [archaeon]